MAIRQHKYSRSSEPKNERYCIFCGKPPIDQNKEHVFPVWLISLTGDPNRNGNFGFDTNKFPKKRNFAFKSFVFPACKICNDKFGEELEIPSSKIVKKILAHQPVSEIEMDKLLDWLDKIRIGLWLGKQQLNKAWNFIKPLEYIDGRIGTKDRLLIAYEIDKKYKGIEYIGTDTPAFTFAPCCFGLIINNLVLLNASGDHLFSKNIGFPYPLDVTPIEDDSSHYNIRLTNGEAVLNR